MVADDNEKSTNLIAITNDNPVLSWKTIDGQPHVLVTTWTAWDTSYVSGQQAAAKYDIWVTAIPELQQWWKSKYDGRTDTVLRIERKQSSCLYGLDQPTCSVLLVITRSPTTLPDPSSSLLLIRHIAAGSTTALSTPTTPNQPPGQDLATHTIGTANTASKA
jgi:hypothetical protein